jgi:DNA polymerase III delta prime subunit
MESIVLEVDDSLAKAWNNSSPELKAMYENKIIDVLKELQEKETEFTEEELAIINKDAGGERYEWWNDEEMVAELDQISADMDSGKDPGFTWEEVKSQLLNRHKKDEL